MRVQLWDHRSHFHKKAVRIIELIVRESESALPQQSQIDVEPVSTSAVAGLPQESQIIVGRSQYRNAVASGLHVTELDT